MSVTRRQVRYLGRCKACKTPVAVERLEIVDSRVVKRRNLQGFVHERTERLYSGDAYRGKSRSPSKATTAPCPSCGRLATLNRLKAKMNPKKKCSARCMNATGPSCECSCGGANHGAGHL